MRKELAKKIIEMMLSLDPTLNSTERLLQQIASDEERKKYRRALGNIMGLIYTDIMVPIIREHPELDPDKDP